MFKVGDKAVYPAHGVGVIKRIETRNIGGSPADFYVLQILASGATLMIPAASSDRAGMRGLATAGDIAQVYETLLSPSKAARTTWNVRFRQFNDQLRGGSLVEIAEVLRDLNQLRADKDLSYGERKMLDRALTMLATEISESQGRHAYEVETEISKILHLEVQP